MGTGCYAADRGKFAGLAGERLSEFRMFSELEEGPGAPKLPPRACVGPKGDTIGHDLYKSPGIGGQG